MPNKVEEFTEPALVSVGNACKYLSIGRSKLYELIREGKLEIVRLGPKHSRITVKSLREFVASLPRETLPGLYRGVSHAPSDN